MKVNNRVMLKIGNIVRNFLSNKIIIFYPDRENFCK